jgi:hypothetical protein
MRILTEGHVSDMVQGFDEPLGPDPFLQIGRVRVSGG